MPSSAPTPVPLSDEALPALPPGWELVRVKNVGDVQLGRQRAPQHHTGPHMRPYLRAANVTWEGIDVADVMEMNFSPQKFENYRLQRDDILLSEASGSPSEVGKPALWNDQLPSCCFQNTLIRVRSRGPLPKHLYYQFLYFALSGRFGQTAKGVGIHHLGAERLAEMHILLPPLAEQRHIVAEVERRLSGAAALEASVAANLRRAERLRQAILKRAFEGRLVPQDPSDEPASALLERIRAARRPGAASGGRQRGAPSPPQEAPGDTPRRQGRKGGPRARPQRARRPPGIGAGDAQRAGARGGAAADGRGRIGAQRTSMPWAGNDVGREVTMKLERITSNPACMSGQPCVRDLRLTVRRVVEIVAAYPDRAELAREYPELEPEDIRQALLYAASYLDDRIIALPPPMKLLDQGLPRSAAALLRDAGVVGDAAASPVRPATAGATGGPS